MFATIRRYESIDQARISELVKQADETLVPTLLWNLPPSLVAIVLLLASNVFMTFAWYGHLRYKSSPLVLAIVVSWGIAFFEYCLQVPANRIGSQTFTTAQLKITHTALRSLLDDFGHEEQDVIAVIHEVLEKLPDEHSIRAILLDEERSRERGTSGPAA